jgi:hypothetical protein
MKFSLASLLTIAETAFGFLAAHDATGTLSSPTSTLTEKAGVLEPTLAAAGVDIVEQGLTAKLGTGASSVVEFALPLLAQIAAAANAKAAALTAPAVVAPPEG